MAEEASKRKAVTENRRAVELSLSIDTKVEQKLLRVS